MLDFQQKKKFRKVMYSRAALLALLVVVILLARSTYNVYKKERLSAENYNQAKKELDDLQARKTMLDSEIARLGTDSGVEEEIRSKFSVAKPGETVVVVVNSSSSNENNSSSRSLWSKFIGWFQ